MNDICSLICTYFFVSNILNGSDLNLIFFVGFFFASKILMWVFNTHYYKQQFSILKFKLHFSLLANDFFTFCHHVLFVIPGLLRCVTMIENSEYSTIHELKWKMKWEKMWNDAMANGINKTELLTKYSSYRFVFYQWMRWTCTLHTVMDLIPFHFMPNE